MGLKITLNPKDYPAELFLLEISYFMWEKKRKFVQSVPFYHAQTDTSSRINSSDVPGGTTAGF